MLVLSASTDMEPEKTLLSRHATDITHLPPWAIMVVPELAVQLVPEGRAHLQDRRFSFDWQQCAEAIKSVATINTSAALTLIETNRHVILKELGLASEYSVESLPQFIEEVDSLDPDLFDRLLAQLDVAGLAPNWVKRLDGRPEEASAVKAILRRLPLSEDDLRAQVQS